MPLTKEEMDIILPVTDKPMDEEAYLKTLKLKNRGEDYGSVMSYDPELAKKYDARRRDN